MKEIGSNTWYTLYQVFGDSLFSLDKSSWGHEEHPGKTVLDRLLQESEYRAQFKDSEFSMQLTGVGFKLENLTQNKYGEPLYFPLDEPNYGDIQGVRELDLTIPEGLTRLEYSELLVGRFWAVQFLTNPIPDHDMVGVPYIEQDPISGVSEAVRRYRYRLLLRSERGVFTSTSPVLLPTDSFPSSCVLFHYWRQSDLGKAGRLCVPAQYQKLAPVEIMLQELK